MSMEVNKKNDMQTNLTLSDEEVVLAKKYILQYIDIVRLEFDKKTIAENIYFMEKLPNDDALHLISKAIVIMKNNGAKSIDEFDKLDSKLKITSSEMNIEEGTQKMNKLRQEENRNQSKDRIQAEIVKYFMFHENEDIRLFIDIIEHNWYEKIKLWYCFIEEFVDWEKFKKLSWSYNWEIKATDEQGRKFTKALVIDKATDTRWLLVTSGNVTIEQNEYEDISKFNFPVETFFLYREDWKNRINVFSMTDNIIAQ